MKLTKTLCMVLLLLNLGLIVHAIRSDQGLLVYLKHKAIEQKLQKRLQDIQADNLDLSRQIRLLKNNPEYQKLLVRKELQVIGENEILYMITP